MHTYPATPPRTPPQPPTNTHGRDRHGPHHRPLQAPKTCATRTPPPGATGAHLSASQDPTQANTHTHGRQAISGPHTHAQPHHRDHEHHEQRQPATKTITTSTSHHDHEAPTQEDTSTNRSDANSTQRSDQRKHQTSRHRNNRRHKNLSQTPQGITPRPTLTDRQAFCVLTTCASLEHESITFAHCWEAMNPRNHAESSLFVCCSTRVRNGLILPLPWVLSLA